MSASPASKRTHSGTEAANVAALTTRPLQRNAGSLRRGTSRRISSAPSAGRKVTTVSSPTGKVILATAARPACTVGGLIAPPGASSDQKVGDEDHGAGQ